MKNITKGLFRLTLSFPSVFNSTNYILELETLYFSKLCSSNTKKSHTVYSIVSYSYMRFPTKQVEAVGWGWKIKLYLYSKY